MIILVFDGYEQELIDKKSISQKQLLKDIETIYYEYFAENNMNLVVSSITVYDDCIMIKPIEKDDKIMISYCDTAFINRDGNIFMKTIRNEIGKTKFEYKSGIYGAIAINLLYISIA